MEADVSEPAGRLIGERQGISTQGHAQGRLRAVVYYDADTITSEQVRAAEDTVGAGAVHISHAGVAWPDAADVRREVIEPPLSWDFLDEHGAEAFARLLVRLANVRFDERRRGFLGVDPLEVARYEVLFGMRREYHRAFHLDRLLSRHRPDLLCLVLPEDGPAPASGTALLVRAIRRSGVQLNVVGRVPRSMGHGAFLLRTAARELRLLGREVLGARWAARSAKLALNVSPVVFAETYTNSSKLAARIARKVGAEGPAIMGLAGAAGALRSLESVMPVLPLDSASGGVRLKDRLRGVRWLLSFRRALGRIPPEEWREISRLDYLHDHFRELLVRKGLDPLLRALRYTIQFTAALDRIDPAAVVTTTYSSSFGRALALVARTRGVPSVYLQHGALGSYPFLQSFLTDVVLLWGECNRRWLRAAGVLPERIAVVGPPKYDEIARERTGPPASPAGPPCGFRVVFLASRAGGAYLSEHQFQVTVDGLAAAVKEVGGVLVIKPHPADFTGLADQAAANNDGVVVVRDRSVRQALAGADLAVVVSSTSGLEACVLGVPLLVYNVTGMADFIDYEAYGAAVTARSPEEVASAVASLCGDLSIREAVRAGQKHLIADMLNSADGKASERVVATIVNLAGGAGEK